MFNQFYQYLFASIFDMNSGKTAKKREKNCKKNKGHGLENRSDNEAELDPIEFVGLLGIKWTWGGWAVRHVILIIQTPGVTRSVPPQADYWVSMIQHTGALTWAECRVISYHKSYIHVVSRFKCLL